MRTKNTLFNCSILRLGVPVRKIGKRDRRNFTAAYPFRERRKPESKITFREICTKVERKSKD
jgi:hypothetical protein